MQKFLIAAIAAVLVGVVATVMLWPEEQEIRRMTIEPGVIISVSLQDELAGGGNGPPMLKIPVGHYHIGSPEGERSRGSDEELQIVEITKPFAIGQFEVTFAEYDKFTQDTGREPAKDGGYGRADRPAINVTWLDAVAYADWVSEKTGQRYRLPTEAEWEFAARAGTTTPFWWGDYDAATSAACNDCDDWKKLQSAPVGQFAANGYGLHDVHGNVWEWTCSNYARRYEGAESKCAERDDDSPKTIRGGSWVNKKTMLRAAVRDKFVPGDRNEIVGFRLARDL